MEEGSLYSIHVEDRLQACSFIKVQDRRRDTRTQLSRCHLSVCRVRLCRRSAGQLRFFPPDPSPKIQTSFPVKNMTRANQHPLK